MRAPTPDEYADFYTTYTSKVPGTDVIATLSRAPPELESLLAGVTSDQETFAYAPGKWSIREVVGHIVDTERLFGFRALHFARGDTAALPGMEQDDWARGSNASARPLVDLLAEFRASREANALFFASLDDDALDRSGVASGCSFTVRSIAFILAGHELHHRGILHERYLPGLARD